MLLLASLVCIADVSVAGGDVAVRIDIEGDLVVIGDAEANGIELWGYKGPPQEVRARTGTTINGGPGPFVLPPLRGRIVVDLGSGDDRLDSTLRFPVGSVVSMGDGADEVRLGDIFGPDLRVDLGAGDDALIVDDSGFGRLLVDAGSGNDVVTFFFSGADNLAVRMGDGNDFLWLSHGYFDETVTLLGGLGRDALALIENGFLAGTPKVVGFETRSRQ
jgi:hypothetical protein